MPSIIVPVPEFPDVPQLPGVPALVRSASAGSAVLNVVTSLLTGDDASIFGQITGPQWGVFDTDNNPLVIPTSVFAFSLSDEARIEKYPIEGGSFSSYNKVNQPFEPRLIMTKDGAVADRTAFIQSLRALKVSIDVCNVVMPEITFQSVNCIHVDFDRKAAQNATMITADVHFEQVNQSGTTAFSNTAQPSGASQTNDGQVQPLGPTPQQELATAPPDIAAVAGAL